MASIQDIQHEIVAEFADFFDWEDKYAHIIALGRKLAPFPEEHRTDANQVRGCQARVWLHAEFRDGRVQFWGDSEGNIMKGLIELALRAYSDHTPEEILAAEPEFMAMIGLDTHLSPTRTNGFASLMKQMKLYALGFAQMRLVEQRAA